MSTRPFLIVSDTHLGAVPESTERAFRDFLHFAGESASGLLINGDLFDFWFEYGSVILREHYRTLAALRDLVETGIPVSFVGGNHDAWAGKFLRDEVGIAVLDGPLEMELGGRRALVAHGDGVGRGDLKYRTLKAFIRNRAVVGAFRVLHPDLGTRIARIASSTEHKADSGDQASRGRASYIQAWAEERLREDAGLELVVAGHAHVPAVVEVEPGRFYVNAGDWIRHFTYLELPAGGGPPELRRWPRTDGAG
ncbi:MAG: UDP-2,3-diacylglucosamine diphosphatase [Gemmatimonadetes bacterium]|nr:UDP-2,3-diacylglucosamine diphosphatase [Gemmatimonadota bacterium]